MYTNCAPSFVDPEPQILKHTQQFTDWIGKLLMMLQISATDYSRFLNTSSYNSEQQSNFQGREVQDEVGEHEAGVEKVKDKN